MITINAIPVTAHYQPLFPRKDGPVRFDILENKSNLFCLLGG